MSKLFTELSDDELIEEYCKGDIHSFEVLLERYMPYIMCWIRQSTNDENDASDLYQEISLRVSLKLKSVYKGKGYFPAWIHCVVSNYLHSTYRKKRPHIVELSDSLLNNNKLVQDDLPTSIPEKYLVVLEELLKEQPEHLQKMIRMRFWDNYTYQEISDITGVNVSTVVKRLKTAYLKLRKQMEAKGIYLDL